MLIEEHEEREQESSVAVNKIHFVFLLNLVCVYADKTFRICKISID